MGHTIPAGTPDYDRARIIERPDGFYWREEDRSAEYGPYPSLLEAVADMQAGEDTDFEPGESVAEAESEMGMSDWIDQDTGQPAEDSVPHIKDN